MLDVACGWCRAKARQASMRRAHVKTTATNVFREVWKLMCAFEVAIRLRLVNILLWGRNATCAYIVMPRELCFVSLDVVHSRRDLVRIGRRREASQVRWYWWRDCNHFLEACVSCLHPSLLFALPYLFPSTTFCVLDWCTYLLYCFF